MATDFVQIDLFSWAPAAPADHIADAGKTIEIGSSFETLAEECKDIEYQQHPLAKEITSGDRNIYGDFSRDESKLLDFGFSLVRYDRENKLVQWVTAASIQKGWFSVDPFPTYAAAERKVQELKDKAFIQTGLDGKIIMSGWHQPGSLRTVGFEFYRVYGLRDYEENGPFCIKVGSKNWSNLAKYTSREALQAAWDELMKNSKALEG